LGTPTLSGQSGLITSAALDINDAGYVVGYTTDQTITRAFFWQGTAFTELPEAGVSIVQANALTNVMANRVIVTGSDNFNATNGRHGLRWVVTLKR
jgi:probable HAF family extracellular repeat protein